MKKLIALILLVCMTMSFAAAETDLKSMTDDELHQLRNEINLELFSRKAHESEKNIVLETEKFLLYSTGKGRERSGLYEMEFVFANKSDKPIAISFDYVIIDGWQISMYDTSGITEPGIKQKFNIDIKYTEADLASVTEVGEMLLSFHTFNESYYTEQEYVKIPFTPEW